MSAPELVPRRTTGGIVAVWVVAAVVGIAIGLFVPEDWRGAWLVVALGGCLLLAFCIQFAYARSQGFILRVAASILGALVMLGVVSLGFGIAALIPG